MGKNIVLIDDDPDELDIIKEVFQEIDPTIVCISFIYPDEAVNALITEMVLLPDFIFIDINMPRKSGYECLSEICAVGHLSSAVKIMYSTSMPIAEARRLLAVGAHHAFQKPTSLIDYIRVVRSIISF